MRYVSDGHDGEAVGTSELGLAERVGIEPTVPLPGQQFSRLPDSATLAPLRLVELAPCQGRLGADVSSLQSAPGGAYRGECDFSIAFLFARRASTMGDPTGLGLSGCGENYCGSVEIHWSARLGQARSIWLSGLSGPSG